MTETLDREDTQESMGVTLAVTHSTGDIEPEEAIQSHLFISCAAVYLPSPAPRKAE